MVAERPAAPLDLADVFRRRAGRPVGEGGRDGEVEEGEEARAEARRGLRGDGRAVAREEGVALGVGDRRAADDDVDGLVRLHGEVGVAVPRGGVPGRAVRADGAPLRPHVLAGDGLAVADGGFRPVGGRVVYLAEVGVGDVRVGARAGDLRVERVRGDEVRDGAPGDEEAVVRRGGDLGDEVRAAAERDRRGVADARRVGDREEGVGVGIEAALDLGELGPDPLAVRDGGVVLCGAAGEGGERRRREEGGDGEEVEAGGGGCG